MNPINKAIVAVVKLLPKSMVYIFAKRYIAGLYLQDAVQATKDFNKRGILTTIDVLGEAITTKEQAIAAKEEALQVLDAIHNEKLLANLSIKPTQFGLDIDEEFAYQQILVLVKRAAEINSFVRLDMEDSATTDKIINLYKRLRETHSNLGIVVQAYLKRTHQDVKELDKMSANYRLCKGIYVEPAEIAYKGKQEVRDNFMKILRQMFEDRCYVGIATHDIWLIDESYKLIKEMNIPKDQFEFQMLLGVADTRREKINKDGYKIRVYTPFGTDWYKYSIRRLKENPNMASQIAMNMFSKRI